MEEKLIERTVAEAMQAEMHEIIEGLLAKNPKLNYIDCVVTYFIMKIADQQKQIVYLEEKIDTMESDISELQPDDDDWFNNQDDDEDEQDFEQVS